MSARHDTRYRRSLLSFSAAALLAVAATAQVASIDDSGNYRREVAACQSGHTAQDRETCLREARNARADKQRGRLDTVGSLQANALARCEVHRNDLDRQACRARVTGQGETSGSVAGGGLLREYEVTLPPESTATAPSSSAPPTSTLGAPAAPVSPAAPTLEPGPASGLQPSAPLQPLERK